MLIFTTKRLQIRQLKSNDKDFFIELLSDPEIREQVPQAEWPLEKTLAMFDDCLAYSDNPLNKKTSIWGVFEDEKDELIGICGLITNEENQRGIAYRFRKKYWRKGFGTEVTKGLLEYCFNELDLDIITADVNVQNLGSLKILEKFFVPSKEYYNEKDGCADRRYTLSRKEYLQNHRVTN